MKSKIIQILSYSLNAYTNHYPVQAKKKKNNTTPKKKKKKKIQLYIDTIIQISN